MIRRQKLTFRFFHQCQFIQMQYLSYFQIVGIDNIIIHSIMDKSTVQTNSKDDSKVIIKLDKGDLHIKVVSEDPDLEVSAWQTKIQTLNECAEILTNFFSDLADFGEHLQDPNNVRVDCRSGILSVLLKTTIRNKQSLTEIARINMAPCKPLDLQNLTMADISEYCQSEQNLSNKMIKCFFKSIAHHFTNLKFDQVLDPIISKFRVVGQSTETIQRKLGGMMEQIEQQKKQIASVQHDIQNSVSELKDYIETVKEGIDREIIRCENKYEVIALDVKDAVNKIVEDIKREEAEIGFVKINLRQVEQHIGRIYNQLELYGKKPNKQMQMLGAELIDKTQPYFNHFKVENNIIVKRMQTHGCSTMLIGKNEFSKRQSYTIKIHKLGMYPILVGAIDSKHRTQQYCEKRDNRVWLSNEGIIFNGEGEVVSDLKFVAGSTVQVIVDLAEGSICWKIGDRRATTKAKLLKNKDIKWLPCIWVGDVGDAIQIKN